MKSKALDQPIYKLSKQIQAGKVSPVDIVRSCLEQINKHNSETNAFIAVLADKALTAAKQAESEIKQDKWRGPLHGIPVAIKDFYDTNGIKTTAAFEQFKDRIPTKDAPIVTKLKEAGAIIIGKTNMHTLGMGTTGTTSYFGAIHNPWNLDYIAGGSSGGSAVAVATGMCYATVDTDVVGSCRLPAACCGVVGFKGSYNLIDNSGILEGTAPPDPSLIWLAHAGIMTRSTQDAALVVDTLATKKFTQALEQSKSLKFATPDNLNVSPQIKQVFNTALGKLKQDGKKLTEISGPFDNPGFDISNIEADRKSIGQKLFKDIDVIVLPTTVDTTPTIVDVGDDPQAISAQNTLFANYYGLPAITISCGFDDHDLPVGVQFVAAPHKDQDALLAAWQYEQAIRDGNWFSRRPYV